MFHYFNQGHGEKSGFACDSSRLLSDCGKRATCYIGNLVFPKPAWSLRFEQLLIACVWPMNYWDGHWYDTGYHFLYSYNPKWSLWCFTFSISLIFNWITSFFGGKKKSSRDIRLNLVLRSTNDFSMNLLGMPAWIKS